MARSVSSTRPASDASPRIAPLAGRPRGDTARRILAVAKDIIARKGVDALRLADISTALGLSPPALYAHFPGGRAELVDRIAHEGVQAMQAFFPRTARSARQDLLEGISGLVGFYADNRAFLRIMLLDFSAPEGHPSITREIGASRGQAANGAFLPMFARLDDIIAECARHDGADRVAADVLLNVVIGATTLNLIYPPRGSGPDSGAAVEAIVHDLVLRYLGLAGESLSRPTAASGESP